MDFLHDPDVETARAHGGVVALAGGRSLRLPSVFGFCGGVMRALTVLERSLPHGPVPRVLLLGPVIHNDTVNRYFAERGVTILPESAPASVFACAGPTDLVVIPAFGVPWEVEAELRRRFPSAQIIDTTCPDVQAVWQFLEALEGEDWTVIIHGKLHHPETRATSSRAARRAARVVILPDLSRLPDLARTLVTDDWKPLPTEWLAERTPCPARRSPVALVNQTTMLYRETVLVGATLREACAASGRTCRLADTVCQATQARQDAAMAVCREHPDLVVVVGSYTSSNTLQLLRLAEDSRLPAYLVPGVGALNPVHIRHWIPEAGEQTTRGWLPPGWRTVGLLAGASCPRTDVGAVIRWFQALAPAKAAP